jgi:hypothetical protein
VANPNAEAVTVSVVPLGGRDATGFAGYRGLHLGAHASFVVDLSRLIGDRSSLAVVVRATRPVLAGSGLYASGSVASLGFSAPAAIPVD